MSTKSFDVYCFRLHIIKHASKIQEMFLNANLSAETSEPNVVPKTITNHEMKSPAVDMSMFAIMLDNACRILRLRIVAKIGCL